jgi:nucleotide-binding universal stress UspA family protein
MRRNSLAKPVVVGIDGSREAIPAATCAAREAVTRDVPLRLVCVNPAVSPLPGNEFRTTISERALRVAAKAVADQENPVKVETVLLTGPAGKRFAAKVLIRESRHASVLCLGAVGMGRLASTALGSTATALTLRGNCPVAIVSQSGPSEEPVAVVLDPTAASSPAAASAPAR